MYSMNDNWIFSVIKTCGFSDFGFIVKKFQVVLICKISPLIEILGGNYM